MIVFGKKPTAFPASISLIRRVQSLSLLASCTAHLQWRGHGTARDGTAVPGFWPSLIVPIFGRSSITELVGRSSIMELDVLAADAKLGRGT
jgi:hypothetical protein